MIGFVFLGIGIMCMAYCWMTLNFPRDKTLQQQIEEAKRTKQVFADLQEKVRQNMAFDDFMAKCAMESEAPLPEITFAHAEIDTFYRQHVLGNRYFDHGKHKAVQDLLELLDQHGDCPSVVDRHRDEPERRFRENNVFEELARVPLYLHTLNAATEATRIDKKLIVPKLVIALLGHDLGKLPAFYARYQVSGTHSFGSVAVIENIPSVHSLHDFESIARSIRNHHLQSDQYFDRLVRECDQRARRMEISGLVTAALEKEIALALPRPNKHVGTEAALAADPIAQEDIFGLDVPHQRAARNTVDVSSWYEPGRFLHELAKIVNMKFGEERFWSALSLGDYVYYKVDAVWQAIMVQSKNDCGVMAAAVSEQDRDDLVYTVIHHLRKMDGVIATELLGESGYGCVFIHNSRDTPGGKEPTRLFLIPLRLSAFQNHSTFGKRKTPLMLRTRELVPVSAAKSS